MSVLSSRYAKVLAFGVLAGMALPGQAESLEPLAEAVRRSGADAQIERVVPSPMPGLYQVELQGGRVIYGSADGRYLLQGFLYESQEKGVRNLTAEHGERSRATMVKELPEAEMVIFPASQPKAQITVFVDTECPFCHKLHEEIADLNQRGVTVRYLAYPRQGLNTTAYETLVSVWCAADPKEAINDAIDGDRIKSVQCENPVKKQYELGRSIGIQGTPAILLDNGQLVTGYQPAEALSKAAIAASRVE